jgi:hypothetical protein
MSSRTHFLDLNRVDFAHTRSMLCAPYAYAPYALYAYAYDYRESLPDREELTHSHARFEPPIKRYPLLSSWLCRDFLPSKPPNGPKNEEIWRCPTVQRHVQPSMQEVSIPWDPDQPQSDFWNHFDPTTVCYIFRKDPYLRQNPPTRLWVPNVKDVYEVLHR